MSWITPVTNRDKPGYFNATDYNRIVGNMLYVQGMAADLYGEIDLEDMEVSKNYRSLIFAEEVNAIENNLATLNENTYNLDLGETKEYYANGPTTDYIEWNRIETGEWLLFSALYGQSSIMQHLAFTLGGAKQFGKRVQYADKETMAYRLGFRIGTGKGGIL